MFIFCSGGHFASILPIFWLSIQVPRKISTMQYFCIHAELLPHVEQVVFHKVTVMGEVKRHYVPIRNLEKIDASEVNAPLMWQINMFDPELIFRDSASGEAFVFDKNGIWNKEALEHPLLV